MLHLSVLLWQRRVASRLAALPAKRPRSFRRSWDRTMSALLQTYSLPRDSKYSLTACRWLSLSANSRTKDSTRADLSSAPDRSCDRARIRMSLLPQKSDATTTLRLLRWQRRFHCPTSIDLSSSFLEWSLFWYSLYIEVLIVRNSGLLVFGNQVS